jgi:hypothetical protein
MFGRLWIDMYDSLFQFPPISHWRGVRQHSTSHNQQLKELYAKEIIALLEANGGHTRYRLLLIPYFKKLYHAFLIEEF